MTYAGIEPAAARRAQGASAPPRVGLLRTMSPSSPLFPEDLWLPPGTPAYHGMRTTPSTVRRKGGRTIYNGWKELFYNLAPRAPRQPGFPPRFIRLEAGASAGFHPLDFGYTGAVSPTTERGSCSPHSPPQDSKCTTAQPRLPRSAHTPLVVVPLSGLNNTDGARGEGLGPHAYIHAHTRYRSLLIWSPQQGLLL
jgi:hypothetical protein